MRVNNGWVHAPPAPGRGFGWCVLGGWQVGAPDKMMGGVVNKSKIKRGAGWGGAVQRGHARGRGSGGDLVRGWGTPGTHVQGAPRHVKRRTTSSGEGTSAE